MSKLMVVISKDEYDRLLDIERKLVTWLEQQQVEYAQTIHCQMAQQAINVVTQQIK